VQPVTALFKKGFCPLKTRRGNVRCGRGRREKTDGIAWAQRRGQQQVMGHHTLSPDRKMLQS